MSAILNPYLNFRGDARAALDFYHSALGGTLNVMTFEEGGMPVEGDEGQLVMHGQIDTPQGWTLMASDVPSHMDYVSGRNTFSVSLSGDDEALLSGLYEKLSDGGEIGEPLTKAPWGDTFGQFRDRFGVGWMVNISGGAA
jgi:PhnB protein